MEGFLSLGFTGTHREVRDIQLKQLRVRMERLNEEFAIDSSHHGDCVGADALFHGLCREINPDIRIEAHPPDNSKLRAFCYADVIHRPLPYLQRDRNIAQACQHLLATPAEDHEIKRSGTWATVRYAIELGRPVTILWPDGTYEVRTG